MAAFTVNSVTSRGPWLVIDAFSTDVSTSTALLANLTGNNHLVKTISVDYQKGQEDRWIKLFDGSDLQVGPVKPGVTIWNQDFGDGLTFEDGVFVQTESDAQIHITMIYRTVPVL